MGEVYAEVQLVANGRALRKRLLVDTGAPFTWIHEADLKRLGIPRPDSERFETIEGRRARRSLGVAEVQLLGRSVPTVVVFAKRSDAEVLGLHALEGLRLGVDPVGRKLRRCKAVKALRGTAGLCPR
jgi:predicted aspartyl protease